MKYNRKAVLPIFILCLFLSACAREPGVESPAPSENPMPADPGGKRVILCRYAGLYQRQGGLPLLE